MRRRSFLAAIAAGTAASLSGCLEGEVVLDVTESVQIPAHQGWIQEIDEVDGGGEIAYAVRSDQARFETFYFTETAALQTYQEFTLGGEEIDEPPEGDDELRAIAVADDERGVYEAALPGDGGRHELTFEGTHYFVVDHSNYGDVTVPDTAEDLSVTVELEVVEDRL